MASSCSANVDVSIFYHSSNDQFDTDPRNRASRCLLGRSARRGLL